MKRLKQLCSLNTEDILDVARRHDSRPKRQRLLEHDVRVNVVNLSSDISLEGYTASETAGFFNLHPRTLRHWQAGYRNDLLHVRILGCPARLASVHERNQVIDLLDELGPATGLPTLRDCFPALARAELENILRRYRRVWKKLNVQAMHRLRWPVPGRVWAMDFTAAPCRIDGLYPHLLAVRDLASGNQLLWLPVSNLTEASVQPALAWLFARHGAPLVLKMDNGSAFIAGDLHQFFTPWGVIPLFSPPSWPRYNGAAEAGIGSLKTRTEAQAALQGHPGYWTWHDAAAARLQANATARPRGEFGSTADELWDQRNPITTPERQLFLATLEHRRSEARLQEDKPLTDTLNSWEQRSLDRNAISRALGDLGYLLFSRRRIALPIKKAKVTKI